MKRINLAELLKDFEGMELDCAVFKRARLEKINSEEDRDYPIQVNTLGGCTISLTKYGTYIDAPEAKCIIFPKGKTTWEGFQKPFKNGDIIFTRTGNYKWVSIFEKFSKNGCYTYIDLCINDNELVPGDRLCSTENITIQRFATEEEKEKLFQSIKDNGYRWNEETKNLGKLALGI